MLENRSVGAKLKKMKLVSHLLSKRLVKVILLVAATGFLAREKMSLPNRAILLEILVNLFVAVTPS